MDENQAENINPIEKKRFPLIKIIIISVAVVGIAVFLLFLFSGNSYYSNELGLNQEFDLNDFVSINLNQTGNDKIATLSFGSFANAVLIHPTNFGIMKINTDVNVNYISHSSIFNVFVNQNLGAGVNS